MLIPTRLAASSELREHEGDPEIPLPADDHGGIASGEQAADLLFRIEERAPDRIEDANRDDRAELGIERTVDVEMGRVAVAVSLAIGPHPRDFQAFDVVEVGANGDGVRLSAGGTGQHCYR